MTYVDSLRTDTSLLSTQDMTVMTRNKDCWRELVHGFRDFHWPSVA